MQPACMEGKGWDTHSVHWAHSCVHLALVSLLRALDLELASPSLAAMCPCTEGT